MSTPRVTVILPAKDAGAYIATTLETLARQFDGDPRAVKLVMINDGSRDETPAIMRSYADRFTHTEIITNATAVGLATARNQGLAHVTTDTFTFLDADDWTQRGRLDALTARLADLDVDFVRTDHVTVEGAERVLRRAPAVWRERSVNPRDAILPLQERSMVDYPYAWAGLLHRRLIDEGLAGFESGLHTAEDRPWIWRLHLQARSFAVVDAPALLYRRGVAGSLTQITDRRQLDFARAMRLVLDLAQADREADRFVPKAVQTVLALSSHHLVKSRNMVPALRADMRASIRDLLATLPSDHTQGALRALDGPRRRLLARLLRQVQVV